MRLICALVKPRMHGHPTHPNPLIAGDVQVIRSHSRGFPKVSFLAVSMQVEQTCRPPFEKHLFYDYGKRARANLGIEGVDLHGGTRHSTMQHLRQQVLVEGVRRLSLHRTNRALDRDVELEVEELRSGNELARTAAPEKGRADQ